MKMCRQASLLSSSTSFIAFALACALASFGGSEARADTAAPLGEPAVFAQVQPFALSAGATFGDREGSLAQHHIVQRAELRLTLDSAVVDVQYGLSGHHQWWAFGIAWHALAGPLVAAKDSISAGARASGAVYGTIDVDIGDAFAIGAYAGPLFDGALTVLRRSDTRATGGLRAGVRAKIIHPWVHAFVEQRTTFGSPSWLYALGASAGVALVWPL